MITSDLTPGSELKEKGRSSSRFNFKNIIKGLSSDLEIEQVSVLSEKTMVDDTNIVNSNEMDKGLLSIYDMELKELEMGLRWDKEESRPISELVLKRTRTKSG